MLQGGGGRRAGERFIERFIPVLHARNGVAHIGQEGDSPDVVAQLAIQGASEILGLMGQEVSRFFGQYADAARVLLDQHATAVQQLVALRLAQARATFADRFGEANQSRLDAMDSVTAVAAETEDSQETRQCPACERVGVLYGVRSIDGIGLPGDDDGAFSKPATIVLVLLVDTFRCPLCGLRLQGQEELEDARLPTEITLRVATDDDILSLLSQATVIRHESDPL